MVPTFRPRHSVTTVALLFGVFGCSGERAATKALVDYVASVVAGEDARACESVWRSELGTTQCDNLARFVRAHAADLPPRGGGIESTVEYGHGAGAEIVIRAGSQHIYASLVCSDEPTKHWSGPGCRWYISALAMR